MALTLNFQEILKTARARRGISQDKLADDAGLDIRNGRKIISNIERGKTKSPEYLNWIAICNGLKIDPLTGADLADGVPVFAAPPLTWATLESLPRGTVTLADHTGEERQLKIDAVLGAIRIAIMHKAVTAKDRSG